MKTEQTPAQSITKSMPNSAETIEKILQINDLLNDKLVHLSFDCPINLRKAFKQECKQNGTSICKELQQYMTSYIVTSRINRHSLGNTLSKITNIPFSIENMSFTQYNQTRSRRKRQSDDGEMVLCEVRGCSNVVVGRMVYRQRNQEFKVCYEHYSEYELKPNVYRVIEK